MDSKFYGFKTKGFDKQKKLPSREFFAIIGGRFFLE
jgi:hypothetical protein